MDWSQFRKNVVKEGGKGLPRSSTKMRLHGLVSQNVKKTKLPYLFQIGYTVTIHPQYATVEIVTGYLAY